MTHGDASILKVQHWLQAHSGDKVTLPAMARKAGLGERTFLRRFASATALRPTAYVQHLRVHKARDLLERRALTVNEVAWRVGYEDPSAFRKIFLRVMGLSPGEYRRRFAAKRQRGGESGSRTAANTDNHAILWSARPAPQAPAPRRIHQLSGR